MKEQPQRKQSGNAPMAALKPLTTIVTAKPVRTAGATLWAGLRLAALFVIVSSLMLCAGVIGLAWKATVATTQLASYTIAAPQSPPVPPPVLQAPIVVPAPTAPLQRSATPTIVPLTPAPVQPLPNPTANVPAPVADADNWVPQTPSRPSNAISGADPTAPRPGYTWVKSYTRADGTIVDGYWRKKRTASAAPSAPRPAAMPSSSQSGDRVWVNGYTRKDGTKVQVYWRSK